MKTKKTDKKDGEWCTSQLFAGNFAILSLKVTWKCCQVDPKNIIIEGLKQNLTTHKYF